MRPGRAPAESTARIRAARARRWTTTASPARPAPGRGSSAEGKAIMSGGRCGSSPSRIEAKDRSTSAMVLAESRNDSGSRRPRHRGPAGEHGVDLQLRHVGAADVNSPHLLRQAGRYVSLVEQSEEQPACVHRGHDGAGSLEPLTGRVHRDRPATCHLTAEPDGHGGGDRRPPASSAPTPPRSPGNRLPAARPGRRGRRPATALPVGCQVGGRLLGVRRPVRQDTLQPLVGGACPAAASTPSPAAPAAAAAPGRPA